MAKIFNTYPRKVIKKIVGGVINFKQKVSVGIAASPVYQILRPASIGVTVTDFYKILRPVNVALKVTPFMQGEFAKEPVSLGLSATNSSVFDAAKLPANLSVSCTHHKFDMTSLRYVENAAKYAVGNNDDWANPQNFNNDNTNWAGMSGGKGTLNLNPKGGGLRAGFQSFPTNFENLQLVSVHIHFWYSQEGTFLGNGTLKAGIEGSVPRKQLVARPNNWNANNNTADIFDITADIGGDWTKLRNLQAWVEGSSANLGRSVTARRCWVEFVTIDPNL